MGLLELAYTGARLTQGRFSSFSLEATTVETNHGVTRSEYYIYVIRVVYLPLALAGSEVVFFVVDLETCSSSGEEPGYS